MVVLNVRVDSRDGLASEHGVVLDREISSVLVVEQTVEVGARCEVLPFVQLVWRGRIRI